MFASLRKHHKNGNASKNKKCSGKNGSLRCGLLYLFDENSARNFYNMCTYVVNFAEFRPDRYEVQAVWVTLPITEGFWISIGNTVFAVVVNVFSPVQSKNFVKVKIMFSRIIILKKKIVNYSGAEKSRKQKLIKGKSSSKRTFKSILAMKLFPFASTNFHVMMIEATQNSCTEFLLVKHELSF